MNIKKYAFNQTILSWVIIIVLAAIFFKLLTLSRKIEVGHRRTFQAVCELVKLKVMELEKEGVVGPFYDELKNKPCYYW